MTARRCDRGSARWADRRMPGARFTPTRRRNPVLRPRIGLQSLEPLAEVTECASRPRLDRPHRPSQAGGDLRLGQARVIRELDHAPLQRRQGRECVPDRLPRLLVGQRHVRTWVRPGRTDQVTSRHEPLGRRLIIRLAATERREGGGPFMAAGSAKSIDRAVSRDRQQPRGQGAARRIEELRAVPPPQAALGHPPARSIQPPFAPPPGTAGSARHASRPSDLADRPSPDWRSCRAPAVPRPEYCAKGANPSKPT